MQQLIFKNCEELLSKASLLYEQGKFSLVYDLCINGLKSCPKMFQLSYLAGLAVHRMGKKNDCVNLLHNAYLICEEDSNKKELHRLLCLHILDAVNPHLTKLITTKILNNDNEGKLAISKDFFYGVQFAITSISNALSYIPSIFQSPNELGSIYYELAKLYHLSSRFEVFSQKEKDDFFKSSLAACKAAVSHQPNNVHYLKYLSELKVSTRDFSGAITSLLELLSSDKEASFDKFLINFMIGKLYLKQSEHHKALEHFKLALQYKTQTTRHDSKFYVSMGRVLCDLNLLDEALDIYYRILSEGIEVDENEGYGSLYIELARIAFKKKEYDKISVFSTKAVNAKGESIGVYKILSVKEWCENNNLKYEIVFPSRDYLVPLPNVLGETFKGGYAGIAKLPETYVAKVEDAIVIPFSDQVIVDDTTCLYDAGTVQDELYDLPGGVPHGIVMDYNEKYIFGIYNKSPKKYIEKGILLTGGSVHNYYHWIFEYITRLWILESSSDDYSEYPLLVLEDMMPKQHYEILEIINDNKREIILLNSGTVEGWRVGGNSYLVKELVMISDPTFHRGNLKGGQDYVDLPQNSAIPNDAINYIRNKFLNSTNGHNRKKLYFSRRNAKFRKIINEDDRTYALTAVRNCGLR